MKSKKKSQANGKNRMKPVKRKQQIAALPFQKDENGDLKVLLVTSRGTGRWVIPKGWTMADKSPWQAAALEALEEAGVTGRISKNRLGTFHYDKWISRSQTVPCLVSVFALEVDTILPRWLEKKQRERRWFAPEKAAKLVAEKELRHILHRFTKKVAA